MHNLFFAVLGFIIAIGVLATVHEFGHFWFARLLGVKVLRFSIGFGKPLATWHDRTGTEYAISAIPLGGYVKMLDAMEGKVATSDLHQEFNQQPIWARMLIVAAGPLFNMFFAIFAYWLMFMIGISSIVPMLGDVPKGSVADIAGLKARQEIVAVNGEPTPTWEEVSVNLFSGVGEQDFISVATVGPENKIRQEHALNVSHWQPENDQNLLFDLGISPLDPIEPVVGKVLPDLPAEQAGLEPDDVIIGLDGIKITSRSQFMNLLHDKYNKASQIRVIRNDAPLDVMITPSKKIIDGGDAIGYIGIQFKNMPWPDNMIRTQRFGPVDALFKGIEKTIDYTVLTLQFLKKMLLGKMSVQHIAGPISIAQFAGQTVVSGFEHFLGFLALVSISLAVLNMLPIPILDGGHFLYLCIELVRGKALSATAMRYGNFVGFAVLGGIMLLALHNDIIRVMG